MILVQALVLITHVALASSQKPGQIHHLRCAQKLLASDDANQSKINELDQKIEALIQSYNQKLGMRRAPFATAFTVSESENIFQRLITRKKDGIPIPSTFGLLVQAIRKSYINHASFDEELVKEALQKASSDLSSTEKLEIVDHQANLMALKYAKEYLNRYRVHDPVDLNGEPLPEKKDKEDKKEQKKEKKPSGPPPPPEYPDLPDSYTPSTENTENESGESQKPFIIAESNVITPYFKSGHFTRINRTSRTPLEQGEIPGATTHIGAYSHTGKTITLQLLGRKNVVLYVPSGYRPLQPADTNVKITKDAKGNYHLQTNGSLAQVEVPIELDEKIMHSRIEEDLLTMPVGFDEKEWPDNIQAEIFRKFDKKSVKQNPLAVAKALSHLIASQYLYSVGERPELDPIEAMKAGAFQCSMAAYAMASIMRDVYQVPTRIPRGYRAKLLKGGRDGKSYLVIPGEGHVWIEIYHDGKWHTFDPTPIKKDKKKKEEEGEQSEFTDVPSPDSPSDDSNDSDLSGEPTDENSNSQSHKEKIDEATKERQKSETKAKELTPEEKQQAMETNELLKNMELGSLGLASQESRNPIWDRVMRTLTRIIVEPTRNGDEITTLLNQSKEIYRNFPSPELMQLFTEANSIHSPNHPKLRDWSEDILYQLKKTKITTTYQKLYALERSLVLYGKLLDKNSPIPEPTELLTKIRQARALLKKLEYAKSGDITLVQNSTEHLPTVARQMLKEDYDFSQVGINSPTAKLAEDIKSKKKGDLRLLNILSPLSDFILNSSPRPEYREVKQLERDPKKNRGTDLMPAVRFNELTRSFMGQPNKTLEQNFRDRTAYVRTKQRTTRISNNAGKQTAERITIVLYDTSGSMSGDPARFQAGLIAAFTAKALSDVDPWGKHRHRVLIIPFDSTPKDATKVTTTAEALNVIRNYQNNLKNTNGGTDIQKALLEAYAQIADAEKRKGEPLAAANIVLMTDGQADIDPKVLMAARNAIDRETPIQLFFAAIGTTNEELMQFANNSEAIGASGGFYREYSKEAMSDILSDADTIRTEKSDSDFFTEKTVADLPPEVEKLLTDAVYLATTYQGAVITGSRYRTPHDHLEDLARIKWHNIEHMDRHLETWLIRVRNVMSASVFKNRKIIERVADDLVTNFEKITGVQLNDLGNHEQEHLKHIVRQANETP